MSHQSIVDNIAYPEFVPESEEVELELEDDSVEIPVPAPSDITTYCTGLRVFLQSQAKDTTDMLNDLRKFEMKMEKFRANNLTQPAIDTFFI